MSTKRTDSKLDNPFPYLWPVGQVGMVAPDRVIAVGLWDSAPIQQCVIRAKEENILIDLTADLPCHWVVFLDSGHIVLATEPMPVAIIDYQGYAWDEDVRAEGLWGG